MLKSAYDALRLLQNKFSSINTFQALNTLLRSQNLSLQVFAGFSGDLLTLTLPSMTLEGLDLMRLGVSIASKLDEIISIPIELLPGEWSLKEWERLFLQSLRYSLKETVPMG